MANYDEKLALVKIEGVEGVDSVPTAAANAIETLGLEIVPMEADASQNQRDQPFSGNSVQRQRSRRTRFTMPTYGTPSGVAGTAPPIGVLLRAAGLSQVVTALTDVTYEKVLSGHESATCYLHHAGRRQIALASRFDLTMAFAAGSDPLFTFEGMGLYAKPTELALPTPDFSAWLDPKEVGKAESTLTIDGYTVNCDNFEFRLGNDLSFVNRSEQAGPRLGNPNPSASARFVAPTITQKDFQALIDAEGTHVATFTHGVTAGSIIEINMPAVQLLPLSDEDMDNDYGFTLPLNPIPDATGVDFSIVYK